MKTRLGTFLFCRRPACCQVSAPDGTRRFQKIPILFLLLTPKNYYSHQLTEKQRIQISVQRVQRRLILYPSSFVTKGPKYDGNNLPTVRYE